MYLHGIVGALERLSAGYNPDRLPPMQVIDSGERPVCSSRKQGFIRSAFLRSMNRAVYVRNGLGRVEPAQEEMTH